MAAERRAGAHFLLREQRARAAAPAPTTGVSLVEQEVQAADKALQEAQRRKEQAAKALRDQKEAEAAKRRRPNVEGLAEKVEQATAESVRMNQAFVDAETFATKAEEEACNAEAPAKVEKAKLAAEARTRSNRAKDMANTADLRLRDLKRSLEQAQEAADAMKD